MTSSASSGFSPFVAPYGTAFRLLARLRVHYWNSRLAVMTLFLCESCRSCTDDLSSAPPPGSRISTNCTLCYSPPPLLPKPWPIVVHLGRRLIGQLLRSSSRPAEEAVAEARRRQPQQPQRRRLQGNTYQLCWDMQLLPTLWSAVVPSCQWRPHRAWQCLLPSWPKMVIWRPSAR